MAPPAQSLQERLFSVLDKLKQLPSVPQLRGFSAVKSDYANWVIPGWVQCGPYPGLDGWNFENEEQAVENLRNILSDGIEVFVCLQDELSRDIENPDIPGRNPNHCHFKKFEGYGHTIKKNKLSTKEITVKQFPIVDGHIPQKQDLLMAVTFVLEQLMQNKKVYIHCAGK